MEPSALAGLDPCVRCGFCLQSCPTFLVTGDESDGPRGRIRLMQVFDRTPRSVDPALVLHLDRCLGCRACETVCPSGVQYGPALESVRADLAKRRGLPLAIQVVNGVMGSRPLRHLVLGAARLVRPLARTFAGPSRLGLLAGQLAGTNAGADWWQRRIGAGSANGPAREAAPDARPVVVFRGCIMEGLFDHVHRATERVLAMNGYRVVPCDGQDCCGALHAHAGQHERAVELARTNIAALAGHGDALIAVNSAGCGAMLREYARLLQGDPLEGAARAVSYRVRDVTELLAARGPAVGGKVALRVAYDPPCHLHHAQRVVDEPAAVLAAIPGVERVEHDEADLCCGSAGSYTVAQPQMSRTVLARKIAALEAAAPDLIVTGNPGCVMQLAAGLAAAGHDVPVAHPVELLDWSYQTAGYYDG